MGGGFKLRVSRMLRASFGSCRSRNIADFIEDPVFPQTHDDFHQIESLSPQVRTFQPICRPRSTERMKSSVDDSFATVEVLQSSEVTEGSQYFGFDDAKGRICPPASPASPLNSYYKLEEFEPKEGKRRSKKMIQRRKKKKNQRNIGKKGILHFDSSSGETDSGWFSTEDETETFFSSRSFSSDSSEIYRRNEGSYCRNAVEARRRRGLRRNSEMGHGTFDSEGKVQGSFAVVKRSSDPYNDFRTSMVEMIVENQLVAAEDLEKLLECFLSLNSSYHHRVIVEVFNEIWNTMFSNQS